MLLLINEKKQLKTRLSVITDLFEKIQMKNEI